VVIDMGHGGKDPGAIGVGGLRESEVVLDIGKRLAKALNKQGEFVIEDRKCNFDVELAVDMFLDLERGNADTYVLWSGDSDFADPIEKLLHAGKKVVLFGTSRRVSRELNALRDEGLIVFDIKKIRDFVCWRRELTPAIQALLE
jgi:N-acetylmuramoyl-L-alanine amidase